MVDVFLLPLVGMFAFYLGFYGLNKRPKSSLHQILYWVVEFLMGLTWFLFSIWAVGPWSGWSQIGYLSDWTKKGKSAMEFPIVLTVIEATLHTIMWL